MNNEYIIIAEAPLLRSGLKIITIGSEKYAVPMLQKMMEIIREFNKSGGASEREVVEDD